MRFKIFLLLLIVGLSVRAEKVGLVLSGGGAKGIAHIGVIKALEDNDIPIDYVAGTSMGAIVGALYSCGYSPEQMLGLVTSQQFLDWSVGRINTDLTYYFDRRPPTPSMLQLQFDFRDSTAVTTDILPGALINPLPMNFAFMDLFSPYTARCRQNFNRLFVPFRCVTSDIYHKHKIVCRSGELGDAVRASMSFPMVYKPIEMDGVLVFDGGIYDNFPVDVMEEDFHPGFIIGVSVSAPDKKPEPGNMYSQLEDMIIQNNNYDLPADEGVKIQVPVLDFGVLDFPKGKEIYSIGYRTGLSMVDSIKSRLQARRSPQEVALRREKWDASVPKLVFDSIKATGVPAGQAKYIENLFDDHGRRLPFDADQARLAYYRLISSGKVSDMRPVAHYDSVSDLFALDINMSLKRKWSAGAGGYLTTSTNSLLYLTTNYNTLSYNALDASLQGWLGQSYYAGYASARFEPSGRVPTYLQLELCASRRKYYDSDVLFYEGSSPSFIIGSEQYVKLGWGIALGQRLAARISIGQGREAYSFYPDGTVDFTAAARDKARYKTSALALQLQGNSLDNNMYPSQGKELSVSVWGLYERSSFHNNAGGEEANKPRSYKRSTRFRAMAELLWRKYYDVHKKLSLGIMGNLLGSIGKAGNDFTATSIHAPGFGPTPSTKYYFNADYRSYNYAAIGIGPVWKPMQNMQLRADMFMYMPLRELKDVNGLAAYGRFFGSPRFICEAAAVYNFNFASLAVYANYLSRAPRNFNFGLAFGLNFEAPRFIR